MIRISSLTWISRQLSCKFFLLASSCCFGGEDLSVHAFSVNASLLVVVLRPGQCAEGEDFLAER